MTAQQFASAFQCFVSAVSIKTESAESFMMLASELTVERFSRVEIYAQFPVCLYYLSDAENAQVAFRKAILSSKAIKNPLIYLNYSIFALECLKNVDDAQQYLNNFYNLCETMKVPDEVRPAAKAIKCFNRQYFIDNHLQYIQIAEVVLSKLPSTLQLPETRAMNHHVRETRIDSDDDNARDDNSTVAKALPLDEADGDMV